jgi:hypothetical protein
MKKENKYPKKLMLWLIIGAITLFIVCLGFLLYLTLTEQQGFNSYTSVSALILSFVSCVLTASFSLATYRNGVITKETNASNRQNSYIIDNYSLLNFCTEITIVKENEKNYNKDIFGENFDNKNGENTVSTNICFLISDYINKPIYKVLFKEIEFANKNKKFFSQKGIDGKYQEHTLNRDYNCMGLNLPLSIADTKSLFQEDTKIKVVLEIISIFNVQFTVHYEITIGHQKNISKNPDKKKFNQLQTYLIHHSIYQVEKQDII